MEIKYNLTIKNSTFKKGLKRIINQTYKLLPTREQGQDWKKPLQTLMEELSGIKRLIRDDQDDLFFLLLCKMEGLFSLSQTEDFGIYRRTIFECLTLLNEISKNVDIKQYENQA